MSEKSKKFDSSYSKGLMLLYFSPTINNKMNYFMGTNLGYLSIFKEVFSFFELLQHRQDDMSKGIVHAPSIPAVDMNLHGAFFFAIDP